jgi:hypothetical protein
MKMDVQMRATWYVTLAIFIGCGWIVVDDRFAKELKIGAFGLVSSVTFWYAPSPIDAAIKRSAKADEAEKE